ncbi:hypothetical protein MKY95_23310 [Paenibacillus sp. FSL P4-0176]|uniref:hypothetical protein n=1 Tax=Paenibacillus sp. FSL P4-0176 TaxID=2921631 RepID=UPI0030D2AB89
MNQRKLGQIYQNRQSFAPALWTLVGEIPGKVSLQHRTEPATRQVDVEEFEADFVQVTVTETDNRKLLREIGYSSRQLDMMSDEDCEAEVIEIPYNA